MVRGFQNAEKHAGNVPMDHVSKKYVLNMHNL